MAAAIVALPGLGVFALGCFCSYLVQRYRRNMVCVVSVIALAACFYLFYCLSSGGLPSFVGWPLVAVLRFVQGAVYGLASMVLSSTLMIDIHVSPRRTSANRLAAWCSRLALPLGPAVGLFVCSRYGFGISMLAGGAMCLLAAVLILRVRFPFKAPEDVVRRISADRFFMSRGLWLFVNLMLGAMVMGLVFCLRLDITFYLMMLVGLALAVLAERFVFVSADPASQVVAGLILSAAALLVMMFGSERAAVSAAPVLLGCSAGLVGARFMLFFIKLSPHCRRGTSQSMYFLSCEAGLSLGLLLGWGWLRGNAGHVLPAGLLLTVAALAMYLLFTHRWYMAHKNR